MVLRTFLPELLLVLAVAAPVTLRGQTITTIAGGALPTGIPATQASFGATALATDSGGNVFIAVSDLHVVLKRNGDTGIVSLVAGMGVGGFGGDGGPAVNAHLQNPTGVVVDTSGNLYIADAGNRRVRKVSGGVISTVAGTGVYYPVGDGGPATQAALSYPRAVAIDSSGNLYILDSSAGRIRKVSNGVISTVATTPPGEAVALAVDAAGNVYFSEYMSDRVMRVSNGVATVAASVPRPTGLAIDSAGVPYAASLSTHSVYRLSGGTAVRFAGNGSSSYSGDGGLATNAGLSDPGGLAADSAGSIYIADAGNNRVRRVSGGVISTVAGNGSHNFSGDNGPALSAQLGTPQSIATPADGTYYIADSLNHRVRKVANGTISTVAGTGVPGFSGDNGPATAAQLNYPLEVAVDAAGNLYILDANSQRVRKVSPAGIISTVAGTGEFGFSGDGGPATQAKLQGPTGLAVDGAGNLYIADRGNGRVRKVSGGIISTVAGGGSGSGENGPATDAGFFMLQDVAADSAGNLYIAEYVFGKVYKVTNGTISRVAGGGDDSGAAGPATSMRLGYVNSLAVDSDGRLYIADLDVNFRTSRVRRVVNGMLSTIAGAGDPYFDNPPGLYELGGSIAIAAGPVGSIFVADSGNQRIRLINAPPPFMIVNASPLPGGSVGVLYSQTLTASGGTAPYRDWKTITGNLPPGITLSSGGVLSGTPGAQGAYSFTVQVTDSVNATASAAFQWTITGPLSIATTSPLPDAIVGAAYSWTLAATGGAPPYQSWSLTEGTLPQGLTLSAEGVLSGTPRAAGIHNFTVQVKDNANATASASLQLTARTLPLILGTEPVFCIALVGVHCPPFILRAAGGTPPYRYRIASGSLPPGITLNVDSGWLGGVPTASGLYRFTAEVTDAMNVKASASLQWTVPPVTNVCALGSTAATIAGSGGVNGFTASNCNPLEAVSSAPWVVLNPTPNWVGYTVLNNPTTASRTATISVGNAVHTVTQSPGTGCTFSLSAAAIAAGAVPSGPFTVGIAASHPDCEWAAAATVPWIQVVWRGKGSGSLAFQVIPNAKANIRSGRILVAGLELVVTQQSTGLPESERLVQLLFFNILGRMPTIGEIRFQVDNGLAKGLSRASLAANIMQAAEFNSGSRFTSGLYVGILDRDAEYGGWLYQRNILARNATAATIADFQRRITANFLTSEEYRQKFGSPDDAGFIRLLYRYILGREPSDDEVNAQVDAMNVNIAVSPATRRAQLAANFLNSAEFITGKGPRLLSFLYYAAILQREGSAQERQEIVNALAQNKPLAEILSPLVSSGEFAALLQ